MSTEKQAKISFKGVDKHFRSNDGSDQIILSKIDLDIFTGELLCIVGPSGCGKSTLINLMAGFDKPSSGSVIIGGKQVKGPSPDNIMIFQENSLYPWKTVLGNILFALKAKGLKKKEAYDTANYYLTLVGLSESSDKFPHQLSGGMKQRAAIARALAVEPEVLFMDEPFAALDAFTKIHMQNELLRLWKEKKPTVVFVTHDLDEAVFLGGRVLVMSPDPDNRYSVLDIDLPRPCDRTSGAFASYRRKLFQQFSLVHEQRPEYVI